MKKLGNGKQTDQGYYEPGPVVTLSRADVAQISYIGLQSWAMQALVQARAVVVPFEMHPVVVQDSITDMVSIMAACALGSALGKLEVKETCGRVVWVSVTEHYVQRDPVIPLTLISRGSKYNKALANYVRHVTQYVNDQSWWNKSQKLCDKVIDALQGVAGRLSAEELAYLIVKLQVPLAWPQGREEKILDPGNEAFYQY